VHKYLNGQLVPLTPEEIAARRAEEEAARVVSPSVVKGECQRRIYTRLPQWKQDNMAARDNELIRIQAGLMIDDAGNALPASALTHAEKAEQMAHKAAWDWVRAMRAASDALEALTPIPIDFADNKYLPV
jgi:hypothetical protein